MAPDPAGLPDERRRIQQELRQLCRGRGLQAAELRLSPTLAARLATVAGAGPPNRGKLLDWLDRGIGLLPADLGLAARVGLALRPEAGNRFLGDRLERLATQVGREQRTVRRRLDEALSRLAEMLTSDPPEPAPAPSSSATSYVRRVRALVVLDRPEPEVFEERTIVATDTGLAVITVAMSVPHPDGASPPHVTADVLFGARLARTDRPGPSHVRFVLRLPRSLQPNEEHRFALRYRLAPGQRMTPRYALTPFDRCDELQLRVRFGDPTPCVWRLPGVPPRSLDDDPGDLEKVEPDSVGEAFVQFSGLKPGLGYGLRWS